MPTEGPEGLVSRFVGHKLPEQAASMTYSESSSPPTQKAEVVTSDEDAGGLTGGSNGSQEFPCLGALQRLSVRDEELSVQDLHISEAFVTDNDGLLAIGSASTVRGSSTGCSISQDVSSSSSSLGNFEDISHSQIASLACTAPEAVVQSWPLRDGDEQSMSGVQTSEVQDPITSHTPDRTNTSLAAVCIDSQITLLAVDTFVKRYRPTELLRNPNLANTEFSINDLDQFKEIADFFCAAYSPEDAFRLHSARWSQTIGQTEIDLTSLPVLRLATEVMRSATSLTDYSYIAINMRHVIMRGADALPATSTEACLLHSHLGNCYRTRKQFGPAEHHCRIALYGYRQSWQPHQHIGYKLTLLTNLALVLEDRQKYRALAKSLEDLYPADLSAGDLIYGYLYGCSMALEDGDFDLTFANVDETLWEQAPTPKDLTNFEVTVLFCYLWAQWQTEVAKPSWRRQRLEQLEKETGIVPIEALSSLSALILAFEPGSLEGSKDPAPITQTVGIAVRDLAGIGELQSRKSNLALRARRLCCSLTELAPTALYKVFLKAYVSPLRAKGNRFTTESYKSRVQEVVREFADSHFSLSLSEKAAEGLRLRKIPDRAPRSPSFVPTMLSTPRSSWSGFASFKSTHRRQEQMASQLPTANGQQFSSGSSSFRRRWSMLSSKTSPRSSIISLMDIEPEDIIMQDAL